MIKKTDIFKNLANISWSMPLEIQRTAMDFLNTIDPCTLLCVYDSIKFDKDKWENFAIVIEEIGYPKNKDLLCILFELLKDMNWPGAFKALEILSSINEKELSDQINHYICIAYDLNDTLCLQVLNNLQTS